MDGQNSMMRAVTAFGMAILAIVIAFLMFKYIL
jgi:hypothetical protein